MPMNVAIHWFRRDLRWNDNVALNAALSSHDQVLPIFIFDTEILAGLPDDDARVSFIHSTLVEMSKQKPIRVEHGDPLSVFKKLAKEFKIEKVYANEDYEPKTIERDRKIAKLLSSLDSELILFKDQAIFHKEDCVKPDGSPYTVFTPFSKKWNSLITPEHLMPHPSEKKIDKCVNADSKVPELSQIGFRESQIKFPNRKIVLDTLKKYAENRNFPSIETSQISPHLRFGTLSVRKAVSIAKDYPVWLNELIWREFFMTILYFFPESETESVRNKNFPWRENPEEFERWSKGLTGYPIVDAGMRELNQTGFMHNRVRMIVASFLCKHLLQNWKQGERYFALKLLDFELSSNVGNWQWVAGTGFDAAPYFRIFNPALQTEKFDPKLIYVKKWVPELNSPEYPQPMVEHDMARDRALKAYASLKEKT